MSDINPFHSASRAIASEHNGYFSDASNNSASIQGSGLLNVHPSLLAPYMLL